jgi:AcrR family transcriptional regulator
VRYVYEMPRRPDPQRKPQLIVDILDHLQDKPLASVSFRTIAQALGFSTYTLVYHFGTRANLLREIVAAASTRATGIEERLQANPASLDVYFDGLRMSWEWTLAKPSDAAARIRGCSDRSGGAAAPHL